MGIKELNQENSIISAHIDKLTGINQVKTVSGKSSDLKEAIENEEIILILARLRKDNYQKKLEKMAETEAKINIDEIPYDTP